MCVFFLTYVFFDCLVWNRRQHFNHRTRFSVYMSFWFQYRAWYTVTTQCTVLCVVEYTVQRVEYCTLHNSSTHFAISAVLFLLLSMFYSSFLCLFSSSVYTEHSTFSYWTQSFPRPKQYINTKTAKKRIWHTDSYISILTACSVFCLFFVQYLFHSSTHSTCFIFAWFCALKITEMCSQCWAGNEAKSRKKRTENKTEQPSGNATNFLKSHSLNHKNVGSLWTVHFFPILILIKNLARDKAIFFWIEMFLTGSNQECGKQPKWPLFNVNWNRFLLSVEMEFFEILFFWFFFVIVLRMKNSPFRMLHKWYLLIDWGEFEYFSKQKWNGPLTNH